MINSTERPSRDHEAMRGNGSWVHVCLFSVLYGKSLLDRPDRPKIPLTGLITTASSRAPISLEEVQKNQSAAGLEGGLFQSLPLKMINLNLSINLLFSLFRKKNHI